MKLSKRRHSTSVDMNMTPMIDIVFLLIIFFMTVSQVSEVNSERLELPELAGSEEQKRSSLIVNVDPQGQIIVSGNSINTTELLAYVSRELAGVGDDPSRLNVVIRADERGTSEKVNEIVRALARLQLSRVRLAVEVPQ